MSGRRAHLRVVVALKGLAERLALFYFEVLYVKIPVRKKKEEVKTGDPFYGREVTCWGVVKSLVSPFVSKVSVSPSAISLAAIALIVASSRAFLQVSLPSRSVYKFDKITRDQIFGSFDIP